MSNPYMKSFPSPGVNSRDIIAVNEEIALLAVGHTGHALQFVDTELIHIRSL